VELRARAVKATAWYVGTRICLQAVTWGVGIALARLLGPAEYGLFAMALAVIAFVELFQEFGLGTAIVRHQELTRPQINAVFWTLMGASMAVAVLAFLLAPAAARFYEEPRLVGIVRALAVTFLLNSAGMVPYSLLTREIDFRRRSLAEAAGAIASAVASLALAFGGHGVWALVGGHLARSAVRNLGMVVASGWMPALVVSFRGVGSVVRFGLNLSGATVATSLGLVLRRTIVARFLGTHDLGMWDMAGTLGERNPLHKVSTSVINQLSLPLFAKLQRDREQLRAYFLQISRYVAMLSLPMQVGMALVAHDLVEVLLTARWLPIVPLLQVFCLGGIFSVLPLPSAPLLTARGRADLVFRVALVSGVALTLGTVAAVPWGLTGLIVAWGVIYPVTRGWLLLLSLRQAGLTVRGYLAAVAMPGLATVVMAGAILTIRLGGAEPASSLERMALDIALGIPAYAAPLLLLDRRLGGEMRLIATELLTPSRA
jgi:O-antigen/teichoic acid export membrane protein